jgi:hypothetical protein
MADSHIQVMNSKYVVPQLAGPNFPIFPGPPCDEPAWRRAADRWAKHIAILFFPWGKDLPPIPTTYPEVVERLWDYRDGYDPCKKTNSTSSLNNWILYHIIYDFAHLLSESKNDRTAYSKFRGMNATVWGDDKARRAYAEDMSEVYESGKRIAEDLGAVLDKLAQMEDESSAESEARAKKRLALTRDALTGAFLAPNPAERNARIPLEMDEDTLDTILENIRTGCPSQPPTIDQTTSPSSNASFAPPEISLPKGLTLNSEQALASRYILKTMSDPAKQLLLCVHGGMRFNLILFRPWIWKVHISKHGYRRTATNCE